MRDYVKVEVVESDARLDHLLKRGWEIFSTNTYEVAPRDQRTQYHVGLPAKVRNEELKEIIRKYEEFGFKEQLFEKVAKENGEKIEEFTYGGGRPIQTKTTDFIKEYEYRVNDKYTEIFKEVKLDDFEY
ncbi:hypothetical protein [Bacillus licheniformis]|uniref:hypothetical protein n=1 Tax=Bacillus licheniformis TaxID=1402 RepID=UPI00234C8065|nr:hypothetical protein [Bacillus licheniformis]WCO63680.1 hypothetical protein OSR41_04865 [Bacillus licheniformis]